MEKPDRRKKIKSYRLALVDAVSHERIWSFRYTRTAMIITIVCDVLGEENNGTTVAAMNLIRHLKDNETADTVARKICWRG